jgi:hypothetical protein
MTSEELTATLVVNRPSGTKPAMGTLDNVGGTSLEDVSQQGGFLPDASPPDDELITKSPKIYYATRTHSQVTRAPISALCPLFKQYMYASITLPVVESVVT